MARTHNFSAGPAALPTEVLAQAAEEMLDYQGSGMSIMEMSHRSKTFVDIAAQAEQDLRDLFCVSDDYHVLFLQGGATGQFAGVPLNLTAGDDTMDFVDTGAWSKKAIKEAAKYCQVNVAAASSASNYDHIPDPANWQLSADAKLLHVCSNETIGGVQFQEFPEHATLVADMSSDILSRPVNIDQFGLIYAGAQKNIGPAGLTVIIVRKDLCGSARPITPTFLDYAVDASNFYSSPVAKADRSAMNVPFTLADAALDADFLAGAEARGMFNLKGHRSVGGMRASIYNAVPLESVQALVNYMSEFENERG